MRAITDQAITLENDGSLPLIINSSDGDARRLINIIEQLTPKSNHALSKKDIIKTLQSKVSSFDKGGDIYYEQLSAFHKSVRGSSPDGALYWICLLYTSDAADDSLRVDLGGRRIIKKHRRICVRRGW